MEILYCKETGEDMKPNGECLIHGKQNREHFDVETNNIKVCEVCGKGYYCVDEIRKVCSMECAREYD